MRIVRTAEVLPTPKPLGSSRPSLALAADPVVAAPSRDGGHAPSSLLGLGRDYGAIIRSIQLVSALVSALALVACEKQPAPAEAPKPPSPAAAQPPAPPAQSEPPLAAGGPWMSKAQAGKDLWATLKTSKGNIVVKLFSKEAPQTVANFVGLATGEKEWIDPRDNQRKKTPLYEGTEFHRVIPNFMIQGGDPTGTGHGQPGFTFPDEFQSGRKFDKKGLLAMANRGPDTNGSQFFITTSTPGHLNGKHTIFGEVISGYPVVEAISQVKTMMGNRPADPVTLVSVTVSDKAPRS
jgi:peptidyl-prolyl cis-trans isomerase A (cyclophilin A)